MWHSLRYYRHSGPVIYKSKLSAPSVSMPCDYCILQSPTKGQVKLVLYETVGRSHIYRAVLSRLRLDNPHLNNKFNRLLIVLLMRPPSSFCVCWKSWINQGKIVSAFPKVKTTAKSVQTTAEVCADYTCSLYRLQLKSPESTTYLQI